MVILLFNTASTVDMATFDTVSAFTFLGRLVENFICSICIGALLAFFAAYMLKVLHKPLSHHPPLQVSIVVISAYLAYMISEVIGYSGAFTLIVCAITLAHYAKYNCTAKAIAGIEMTSQFLGLTAEGFMFSYIGFAGFKYINDEVTIGFIALVILFAFVSRFIMVFGLGVLRMLRRKQLLWSWADNALMWLGGCKRGAVAMALITSVETSESETLTAQTVFFTVVFTTFFLGLILPWFLRCIKRSNSKKDVDRHKANLFGFKQLIMDMIKRKTVFIETGAINADEVALETPLNDRNSLKEEFDHPSRLLQFCLWIDRRFLARCLIVEKVRVEIENDRAKEYTNLVAFFGTKESKVPLIEAD
jgi:NhaP-type Na+/H+ or K+/H+ antiporter